VRLTVFAVVAVSDAGLPDGEPQPASATAAMSAAATGVNQFLPHLFKMLSPS